jgi:hypothetical protein
MVQLVSCQLLTMAARVQSQVADVEFVLDKLALAHVFLPEIQSSPVSITPLMLHTH